MQRFGSEVTALAAASFAPVLEWANSYCFPVVELAHAFELFMSGATGKVVVEQ